MKPRIPRQVVSVPPRIRDGMDAGHLRNIRLCPCLICGARLAGNAHHLLVGDDKQRGMGRTEADKWAVPLCSAHHDPRFPHALHFNVPAKYGEEEWFMLHGIDGREAARVLWRYRGALDKMVSAVVKLRMAARLKVMQREHLGL